MSQVACPHCGFQNFAISAYCGRCERPLRPGGAASARDATPPPREPPPKPSLVRDRPTPRLVPAPVGNETDTQPPEPAPMRPRPRPTPVPDATPVPTPPRAVPPPQTEEVAPAPLPIELRLPESEPPRDLVREAETRPPEPDLPEEPVTEPPPPPLSTSPPVEAEPVAEVIEVPVTVASEWRLAIGWLIDAATVTGLGVLVALLEVLIFGGPTYLGTGQPLDALAEWLASNGDAALHGVIVAVAAAVAYALYAGRRGGRTLGRILTGTVLVRASGRPLSWAVVIFRTFVALFSTAPFFAGFFWVLLDRQRRTWHDLLAGTVVVRRHVAVGEPVVEEDPPAGD